MRSGIDAVGQVPRGTHICCFFQTPAELDEVLMPYFEVGIEDGDACLWIAPDEDSRQQMNHELGQRIAGFDTLSKNGTVTILDISRSESSDGRLLHEHISKWAGRMRSKKAPAGKKTGLRIGIDMRIMDTMANTGRHAIEAEIDGLVRQEAMLAICAYPLNRLPARSVIELMDMHAHALVKTPDEWRILRPIDPVERHPDSSPADERVRRIFQSAGDAILMLDQTGVVVDMNETTQSMFGFAREEVLGKHFSDLGILTPEDALWTVKDFRESVASREPGGTALVQARRKDGSILYVEGNSRPLMRGNKVEGLIATLRDVTQRVQAEMALRTNEEKYRALFEGARDAIFQLDTTGRICEANRRAEEVFGYRAGDLVGKTFAEIGVLSPETARRAIDDFRQAMARGELEGTEELEAFHRDGRRIIVEAGISPLQRGNEVEGVIAIVRDITERKEAVEALRASEERFKTIFQNTNDEIIYLDESGTIVDVNRRVKDIFGWEPEEIIGKSFAEFDFIEPAGLSELIERFAETMSDDRETVTQEFRIKRKDGTPVYIEVSGRRTPLNGDQKGLLGVVRDITARRQTEQALRDSEQRFRTMFESANDIILQMDRHGTVTDANSKVRDVIGYEPEELIGKHFSEIGILNPGDTLYALNRFHQIVRTGKVEERAELAVIHKEGTAVLIEMSITPLMQGEETIGLLAIGRDVTARREAEKALQQSEGRFRSLIEHSADMIVILDREGTIQYASPSLLHIAGYDPLELLGRKAFDFVHPDHVALALETFAQGKETPGFTISLEIELLRKDGTWRWVELTGRNLLDDPAVHGAVLNFHEIHERKLAEQALSDSEQRFRSLIENAHDAITLIDETGVILYESPSVERITGYKPGTLIGTNMEVLILPDDIPRVQERLAAVVKTPGHAEPLTLRLRRADGTWCWLDGVAKNFLDDPKVNAIVCNYRDVTERVEAEQALYRSEQRYRALVENANEVIFSLDKKGRFTYASPIMQQLSGYEVDEIVGTEYTQHVVPEDLPTLKHSLERSLAGFRDPCEFRIRHRDGSLRDVRTSSTVLMEDGGPAGLIGVMTDITEQKRSEEALRESEEKFRTIFENANDVIVYLEEFGIVADVNRRAEDIFGYEREELIGRKFTDVPFLGPEAMQEMLDRFERAYAADIRELIDVEATRKDGSTVYVEASTTLVRRNGDTVGLLAIVRDVTERKRAEEALRKAYDEMEMRVQERTAELVQANRDLQREIQQRERVQEALRQSEERYRLVADNTGDLIALSSLDGVFAFVSPSHRRLGYEPSELVGTRGIDLVHPKEKKRLISRVRKFLEEYAAASATPDRGAPSVNLEYRIRDRDGNWHNLETLTNFVLGDDGETPFLVHVARDVTERKQAAEALRESEENLRTIFRNVKDEILYIDENGVIIDDNGKGMDVVGYSRHELVGKYFADLPLLRPQDIPWMKEIFASTVATGEIPDTLEFEVVHKHGNPVFVEASVSIIRRRKKVAGLLVILRDITERKRAEEAIRESEEKFRTIFENANDEIIYLDTDGRVIDRNVKGANMLGYTLDEMIGKRITELDAVMATDEQMAAMTSLFRKAVHSGDVRGLTEIELIHKDGNSVFAEASVSPLYRSGKVAGILVIVRDVTDRKQAEERLRQYANELQEANEELRQYAQVASHDICAPLRAIRYYTHLLRRDPAIAQVEHSKGYLSTIDSAVVEGEELAERLLELARIGQRGLRRQRVDVRELISSIASSAGWDCEVTVDISEDLPTIKTDPTLIRQIFRNLMDNSVKFNHSSTKHIEVGVRPVGKQRYQFWVRDNGIGIAPRDHKRIFNIFQRLHHKDEYRGTGIGLAVVKKAAAKLGGSVKVESKVGEGSTFYVTLPKTPPYQN